MGSNGASNDGGYGQAQRDRKKSTGGTKIGFEGTYKSDLNPNVDPKPKKKDTMIGGNGDGNQVVQSSTPPPPVTPPPPTPTVAEVSQSSTTDAEDPYSVRRRKTLAKGRSATIITSSRGVRRDDTLTLGKPSLLGA